MNELALKTVLIMFFVFTGQLSSKQIEDQSFIEIESANTWKNKEKNETSNSINAGSTQEIKKVKLSNSDRSSAAKNNKQKNKIKKINKWLKTLPKVEKQPKVSSFINEISPLAVIISEENNIYPSVMIAQAGLESGWGTSRLAKKYNNLMGTKGSWQGKSVTMSTSEEVAGEKVRVHSDFTIYDSWADSLERYGKMLRNGLEWDQEYYKGTWRENSKTHQEATAWLVGRYATDSSYAEKLNKTIETYNLTRFDEIELLDFDYEDHLNVITNEI